MHPAAAPLLAIIKEVARRYAEDPDNQDRGLDWLEDIVRRSENKYDDKWLLPAFEKVREYLGIPEDDPRWSDTVIVDLQVPAPKHPPKSKRPKAQK